MMESPEEDYLRVVVARQGKLRTSEFRLRRGEVGLSLFRREGTPDPQTIIEAVRQAGKQGELSIAEIPGTVLRELGLRLVKTPGGTPDPEVNRVHVEARLSRWIRLNLWLRRVEIAGYFNDGIAPRLAAAARLLE
jgi:hypothetical protein